MGIHDRDTRIHDHHRLVGEADTELLQASTALRQKLDSLLEILPDEGGSIDELTAAAAEALDEDDETRQLALRLWSPSSCARYCSSGSSFWRPEMNRDRRVVNHPEGVICEDYGPISCEYDVVRRLEDMLADATSDGLPFGQLAQQLHAAEPELCQQLRDLVNNRGRRLRHRTNDTEKALDIGECRSPRKGPRRG
jgi:hypothetical protein